MINLQLVQSGPWLPAPVRLGDIIGVLPRSSAMTDAQLTNPQHALGLATKPFGHAQRIGQLRIRHGTRARQHADDVA